LFIDSDGHVARDIEKYGCLLLNKCVLVLDDYESDLAPEKSALIKDWVDSSIDSGQVCSLGIYGWGTWVGVYNKTSHLSS
jgi:hypothetical protein